MKKILVTGGAGFIGSHTVNYLLSKGIKSDQIVVFDNLVYGHKEYLPEGILFVKGDLLNKKDVFNCFSNYSIDSVIHFAAYAYVGESMQNPGKYLENNIFGGINLLEGMVKYDIKNIVFSSTCATYGIPKNIPISEIESQSPINPYGESKLIFEKILDWYDKIYGIKSVRLRYFNAAGAGFGIGENHNPETHLIPLVIETSLGKRNSIKIFGNDYNTPDGTCIRDYIHVIDLADAHLKAIQYLKKGGKTDFFNLGTGIGISVMEIIDLVKNISGKDFDVVIESRRFGDPAVLIADNQKIKNILGWTASKNIKDIVNDAYKWSTLINN